MCWSFESSLFTSIFSYSVAIILMARGSPTRAFYGGAIFGVCAMQLAEAFLWHNGDLVEQCKLGGLNRLGTQVFIRLALMAQPMGPYLASRRWLPRSLHWAYAVWPVTMHSAKPLRWLLVGDNYTREGRLPIGIDIDYAKLVHCTTLTPQGYLDWGAEQHLALHLIWFAYIAWVPLHGMHPLWKSIALSLYGLACLLFSWATTDSVGSNWCLYVSGYALLGLIDFCVAAPDAPAAEQRKAA